MTILITGAAQGIGAAIATQLATISAKLILVDLQMDKLVALQQTLTNNVQSVELLAGDLTNQEFMQEIAQYAERNPIDVLINNAGIAHQLKPITELSVTEFDLGFNINVKAPFQLIQSVLPAMQKHGSGLIINIASRANIYGYVNMGIYAATKAALTSLTGTIALENPSLKALTIIPGRTNTPMQARIRGDQEAQKSQSPDYVAGIIKKVIAEEVVTTSGDVVIIDFENYAVVENLVKSDLHRNMH